MRVAPIILVLALTGGMPVVAAGQASAVRLADDTAASKLVISIGPVDLPAGGHHEGVHGAVLPPVASVTVPARVNLYGFDYDVIDAQGRALPRELVHHINLIDPDHRELFLPISQRMLAVGKETGSQSLPRMLFGYPIEAGGRIVVSAMLHNPTHQDYTGATVRVHLKYVKDGGMWPMFSVYPFQLDVAFPAGDKSFPLPPGKSSRSYEASPGVEGRLLAIGGHTHAYAVSLTLEDVTKNRVIWEGKPELDAEGDVVSVPVARLYRKLGVKIYPDRKYRVTVSYINPTADTLVGGGMGVIGGVFMPTGGAPWPKADSTDQWYALDRKHYLREVQGTLAAIKADSAKAATPAHVHKH